MNSFLYVLVGLYGLFFLVAVGILIFLKIRRSKVKKLEDFEKRDN